MHSRLLDERDDHVLDGAAYQSLRLPVRVGYWQIGDMRVYQSTRPTAWRQGWHQMLLGWEWFDL